MGSRDLHPDAHLDIAVEVVPTLQCHYVMPRPGRPHHPTCTDSPDVSLRLLAHGLCVRVTRCDVVSPSVAMLDDLLQATTGGPHDRDRATQCTCHHAEVAEAGEAPGTAGGGGRTLHGRRPDSPSADGARTKRAKAASQAGAGPDDDSDSLGASDGGARARASLASPPITNAVLNRAALVVQFAQVSPAGKWCGTTGCWRR